MFSCRKLGDHPSVRRMRHTLVPFTPHVSLQDAGQVHSARWLHCMEARRMLRHPRQHGQHGLGGVHVACGRPLQVYNVLCADAHRYQQCLCCSSCHIDEQCMSMDIKCTRGCNRMWLLWSLSRCMQVHQQHRQHLWSQPTYQFWCTSFSGSGPSGPQGGQRGTRRPFLCRPV
jgi:hypothetical protein